MLFMSDISIIIPTYNRLWSLPQAVQSCRSTGCSVEIIVVDDGSTDGTWEWVRAQPGIVSIRTENWGGLGVDSDADRARPVCALSPTMGCRRSPPTAELARQTGADIVVAGYEHRRRHRRATGSGLDCDDFIAQQLGEGWSSHYSAFLFRRELVQDIPHRQDFALRDDRMFMLEVALRKPRLAVYRKPGFVHRQHPGDRLQRTTGFRRDLACWTFVAIFRKVLAMLEARGELTLRRKRAAIATMWDNVRTLAKTYPDEAAEIVDWIDRLDPECRPPVLRTLAVAYKTPGCATTERPLHEAALK